MTHIRARRRAGFTLIELMVALVVAAILMALAVPSFLDAVRKSRRADAMAALTQVQQAQERYRANNAGYASTLAQLNVGATSQDGHYSLSIVQNSATGSTYTAAAAANSGSTQAGDSPCQFLQIAMNAGNLVYQSSANGSTWNSTNNNPCWVR